jgi:hypothetical protein
MHPHKPNYLKQYSFQYQCDWEQFVRLEASLHKILQNPQNFNLVHNEFMHLMEQVRELKSIIDIIKMERKSYASMIETNKTIQAKLQNHNNIIASIEQSYADHIKAFTDDARIAR